MIWGYQLFCKELADDDEINIVSLFTGLTLTAVCFVGLIIGKYQYTVASYMAILDAHVTYNKL